MECSVFSISDTNSLVVLSENCFTSFGFKEETACPEIEGISFFFYTRPTNSDNEGFETTSMFLKLNCQRK